MASEDMTIPELQRRIAYRNACRDRVGPLASAAGPSGTGIRVLSDLSLFESTPQIDGENLPEVPELPPEEQPPESEPEREPLEG